jgi:uncharacterized repeat protein (TIGR03803 family)
MPFSAEKLLVVLIWVGFIFLGLTFSTSASAGTETVLYTFTGTPDASAPYSALVRDQKGNLYGVTGAGGANRQGAVYEMSPTNGGGWTETVLHSFDANGSDGYAPGGGLTFDAAGNLYGTTIFGGTHVFGTVFELSPTRSGLWTETIIYNFTGGNDGGSPQYGSLVFDGKGNLYGTTQNGGAYGYGVAFELSLSPDSSWTETVLHDFAEDATDGGYPMAVVFDKTGNLYGTAAQGGSLGRGVIFELSPSLGGRGRKRFFTILPTIVPMVEYRWQVLFFTELNFTARRSTVAVTLGVLCIDSLRRRPGGRKRFSIVSQPTELTGFLPRVQLSSTRLATSTARPMVVEQRVPVPCLN